MGVLRTVVAFALLLALAGCGEQVQTEAFGDRAASVPAAPAGTRWVGSGQAVVAVPDWWTTGGTQCLAPVEDTVYLDSGAVADCAMPVDPEVVRGVSALAVLHTRNGYGEALVRDMVPAGEADGREVVEREGCEHWFEGVCRRMFAVPSEGVVFALTLAEGAGTDYEQVRDSLRILPETTTTLPLTTRSGWTPSWGAEPATATALVRSLERAGFRVEVDTVEPSGSRAGDAAGLPEGSLLNVEPALGSPAEAGSTVTVTTVGEPVDRSPSPGPGSTVTGLPCPPGQRTYVSFDVPGPGRPTPQDAATPLLAGLTIGTVDENGRRATVTALDIDGVPTRIYQLTRARDGWWPDAYTRCAAP